MNVENRRIGFALKVLNNAIRRRLDAYLAEAGLEDIGGMRGPLLGYLYAQTRERDVFQKDIEKEFNIRRSTATVMLQRLEEKGYLIREPHPDDARLKRILLTDKGRERHLKARRQIQAFDAELEQGIAEQEKEFFLKIVDKMIKNLEQEDGKCTPLMRENERKD